MNGTTCPTLPLRCPGMRPEEAAGDRLMPPDREKARIAALETGLRRIQDALPEIDDYDNYAETIAREVIAELLEPIEDAPS